MAPERVKTWCLVWASRERNLLACSQIHERPSRGVSCCGRGFYLHARLSRARTGKSGKKSDYPNSPMFSSGDGNLAAGRQKSVLQKSNLIILCCCCTTFCALSYFSISTFLMNLLCLTGLTLERLQPVSPYVSCRSPMSFFICPNMFLAWAFRFSWSFVTVV